MNTLINVNCIKDKKIYDILMKNVAIIRLPWMLLVVWKVMENLCQKYISANTWTLLTGMSSGFPWDARDAKCTKCMYAKKYLFIFLFGFRALISWLGSVRGWVTLNLEVGWITLFRVTFFAALLLHCFYFRWFSYFFNVKLPYF